MRAGDKRCAGALWTNRFIVTADHCIPYSVESSKVVVTLGGDLKIPEEVQAAKRIIRYPGNTSASRSRDVALIELEQGMLVNGQRTGYLMNVYPRRPPGELFGADLKCVGWAFDATIDAPRFVSQRNLWVDSITYTLNEKDPGDQVFLSSNENTVITPFDEGGGCFVSYYGIERQFVVMTGPGRGLNLSEGGVLKWLFNSVAKAESVSLPEVSNNIASVETIHGIELYWVSANGALSMSAWPPEGEPVELAGDGTFLPLRPAGLWLASSRLLVAVGADGVLSYAVLGDAVLDILAKEGGASDANLTFQPVGDVPTTTSSGVSLTRLAWSDVKLFVRGENDELRMSSFDGGAWSPWEDLGEELATAPSAVAWSDERIDVFAKSYDTDLIHRWFDAKSSVWSAWESTMTLLGGTPVVSSWAKDRLDLFILGPTGNLFYYWYDRNWYWYGHFLGTSVDLGDEPALISPYPGRLSFLDPNSDSVRELAVYPE